VAVTGHVLPAPEYDPRYSYHRRIYLQRLVSGTWRTVTAARVRDSGRYTLTTTAPSHGTHLYRVYKPGSRVYFWRYIGGFSRTIIVRTVRC
jgi:hypothetical protein